MNPKTIAFHHFGCKVNFAEASTLSRQFSDKGYKLIGFHEEADIYVISSCVVTATAEKKCRAAIRQAHLLNPRARIAVIGCYSELKAEELSRMEGVDVVLGHQGKFDLLNEIERRNHEHRGEIQSPSPDIQDPISNIQHPTSDISNPQSPIYHQPYLFVPSHSFGDRTRSFLKIQDGCDYHCSYCTIPLARGKSRSGTIAQILDEARKIAESGVKEIILTGVNIGDFGKHQGETLVQLLWALEKSIDIPRIRISSIEPDLLRDEIIDLVASSEKFMPHFHLPLQSGSNAILKKMKRKYTTKLYTDRVGSIRHRMPGACIAADVIVGFPEESDLDFKETYQYLEQLPVSYMHVFSYSKRERTLAAGLSGNIPKAEKKRRSDQLHLLSSTKKTAFYRSCLGNKVNVLFESDNKQGMMHGFSENYIKVKAKFDPALVNEIRQVRLEQLDEDLCYLWSADVAVRKGKAK